MSVKFSELKIIFSNCLIDGSAWADLKVGLFTSIRESLYDVTGLEFKAINLNNVSGDHTSFSIIVVGTFYKLSANISKDDMINLDSVLSRIVRDFPSFKCEEVRVEHTRHRSLFKGLSHPQLARII